MISEPKIEYREELPFLAIPARVAMKEIPVALPPLISEVYSWLAQNSIEPAGPLFFHYTLISGGLFDVEVGVPIRSASLGGDRLKPGIFPSGRYAVCTH
ncbi:hypothetical protein BH24BAC1_BH24BAC1_12810 [soil metagenome]